jgi:hypothetical protein
MLIIDEKKLMAMETMMTIIVAYGGCAKMELIVYISYSVEVFL